ncbi:rbcL [Symbiodinium necroappetens]|uniref:RbcL protein n=1 Tax=Symbiodinium necroappetens TaxID=1628268 RepID=A0A813A541_9DINO|nr:rbcL [Symbiodinium necroappetens]
MALSGAGSSVAFAIAPTAGATGRMGLPAQAEAKPVPGKISQSSLPVACAGLMVPVLGAVRRGKKKSKTAMKDATYAFQRDAYADLEFTNDVGYLPDGTPLNKAGNAVNHPETIGADRHVAGSPLPRAKFVNSVGYLPDGTAMNAAGNAINHPEAMQPDQHIAGSPLPPSTYLADIGYLADGTPLAAAGNNSVKGMAATPPPAAAATAAPPRMASSAPPQASTPMSQGIAMHGRKFEYSFQKDAYADLEFCNDVGYLPDGTALNRAGNAINHPETIGPDRHAPGSPLPRANFVNSVGYLPDGTPLNRAGNAINHPESIGPDMHAPGSPLPASVYAADVGYLVDGTPMDRAGNLSVST